jgi:hypothetical protein
MSTTSTVLFRNLGTLLATVGIVTLAHTAFAQSSPQAVCCRCRGPIRFYGPKKPLFDKTWKLPDIERMN